MKTTVKQLTDFLISRTDNENDKSLFWTGLDLTWEDPKIKDGEMTRWKSHSVKLWWDLERLGWNNQNFDWSRKIEPRFIWIQYKMTPESDDIFDFDPFRSSELYECLEIGKDSEIDFYELVVDLEGVRDFYLSGIKLKTLPNKLRDEVIQKFRENQTNIKSPPLVIDRTPVDENGHIQIDDWNPYQDDTLDSIDDHLSDLIWEGSTDVVSENIDTREFFRNDI